MFPRQPSPSDSVVKGTGIGELWSSRGQRSEVADVDDDLVVLKGRGQLEDVV